MALVFTQIADAATWHEDVELYELADGQEVIGYLYMDLYARTGKRSGAWMSEHATRYRQHDKSIQLPVAYLVTNILPGNAHEPAKCSHDDLITIFHEMGHCLQHLLSQVDELEISGINGIPWDAVEIASQLHEGFCYEQVCLDLLSNHYQRNEKLPPELLAKIIDSKNFNQGISTLRQIEFALFDIYLHSEDYRPQLITESLAAAREQTHYIDVPSYNRFAHSFSHIFAGGYAAGYYSYKWAEILAINCFYQFKNNGVLNGDIGKRCRNTLLGRGASQPVTQVFRDFCQHDSDANLYFDYYGLS